MRQHYLIGKEIRHRYIDREGLINKTYNHKEIEFYSSDTSRTLNSAQSQISGIFSHEVCQQKLNNFQRNNSLPPLFVEDADEIISELKEKALPECHNILPTVSQKDDVNFLYHFENSNCPAYQELLNKMKYSKEYFNLVKPHVDYLKPRLHQMTGMGPELSISEINKMCSYLIISDYHKKHLKFKYEYKDVYECTQMIGLKLYYVSWGDSNLWKLGSKVFYENLINSMDNIINGTDQAKIQLYFAHNHTLSIFLNGLGQKFDDYIPFASTLFFELHFSNSSGYSVRILYNDNPISLFSGSEYIPYQQFKDHLLSIHPKGDIEELCKQHFDDSSSGNFWEIFLFGSIISDWLKSNYIVSLVLLIFIVCISTILCSCSCYRSYYKHQSFEDVPGYAPVRYSDDRDLSEEFHIHSD